MIRIFCLALRRNTSLQGMRIEIDVLDFTEKIQITQQMQK